MTQQDNQSWPKGMKWYIAGPMTGYPQFNYPKFDAAVERVNGRGYIAVPPADLNDPRIRKLAMASADGVVETAFKDTTWGDFLSLDVKLVADDVDGVAVLPGWQDSRGACLETFVATLCNKPIVWEDTWEPVSPLDLALAWTNKLPDRGPDDFAFIDALYVVGSLF